MASNKRGCTEAFESDSKRTRGQLLENIVDSSSLLDFSGRNNIKIVGGDLVKEIRVDENILNEASLGKEENEEIEKENGNSSRNGNENEIEKEKGQEKESSKESEFVESRSHSQEKIASSIVPKYYDKGEKEEKEFCYSNLDKNNKPESEKMKTKAVPEKLEENKLAKEENGEEQEKIMVERDVQKKKEEGEKTESSGEHHFVKAVEFCEKQEGKELKKESNVESVKEMKKGTGIEKCTEAGEKQGEPEKIPDVSKNFPNQKDEKKMASRKMLRTAVLSGVAEDKGSRHTMEDTWTILTHDTWQKENAKLRCLHFAVYDGHGGKKAADFAKTHLHTAVLHSGFSKNEVELKVSKKAIIEGIKKVDEDLLKVSAAEGWADGATAVCVWILGQTVFVANLGDAKAVLARSPPLSEGVEGEKKEKTEGVVKGIVITREHKAIFPGERARIEKAGGFVAKDGRLMGRVEVSRALGDRPFKKVGLSAVADVAAFELTERERFLILGCDGLWGVYSAGDAVEFVEKQLKEGVKAEVICRRMVREAIRERRCKDNCTALLILFQHQYR